MSKLKNMAVFSAMLVGVMIYTSPAKSAVCFLPDDDGSCGGGDIEISDDSTSENQCADFTLSQNQRNSKGMTATVIVVNLVLIMVVQHINAH